MSAGTELGTHPPGDVEGEGRAVGPGRDRPRQSAERHDPAGGAQIRPSGEEGCAPSSGRAVGLPKLAVAAALVTLAILTVAGYAGGLHGDFMLDDRLVLFGPTGVESFTVGELFQRHQNGFHRPVGHLVLLASHRLFGDAPTGYHAVNLGLFVLAVWAVFGIARELVGVRLAWLTAALFAVHPYHAFLVDYVTASVIGTFLLLESLAFLCYLRFYASRRRLWLAAGLVAFAGALLAHEVAVVLPLVVALHVHWAERATVREILHRVAPWLFVLAAYMVAKPVFMASDRSVAGTVAALADPLAFVGTLGRLVGWYLEKLVWPEGVLFLWSEPLDRAGLGVGLALLVAAVLAAVWSLRHRGVAAFATGLFLLGFLPAGLAAFTYVGIGHPLLEPHWLYFNSLGFFLLVALAARHLWERRRGLAVVATLLVAGAWMTLLVGGHRHWRDQETYCRYWLSLNQRDWTPHHGLAMVEIERGDYRAAVATARRGLAAVAPHEAVALHNALGVATYLAGDRERGLEIFEEIRYLDPGYFPAYVERVRALRQRRPEAVGDGDAIRFASGRRLYLRIVEELEVPPARGAAGARPPS